MSNSKHVTETTVDTEVVKTQKGKEIEAEKIKSDHKIDPKILEQKRSELMQKKKEFDEKLFAITDNIDVAKNLHQFIINDAKWSYSECLGVIKADEILQEQIKNMENGQKNLFLGITVLEAIHYFMKKETGTGFTSAQHYIKMLEPIGGGLQRAQKEYEKLQELEFNLASLEQGIDVETNKNIDNIVNE
jgi:hypothetical protein